MDEEQETADPKKRSSEGRPRAATTEKNHKLSPDAFETRRAATAERGRGERQLDGSQFMGGVQGGGRFDIESSA